MHGKEASRPGIHGADSVRRWHVAGVVARRSQWPPTAVLCSARPQDRPASIREQLVYSGPDGKGICPCCDMAGVKLSDGSSLVAFRNTDAGHRDIWFARAPGGGPFGPARPLSLDNWTYSGCPHDAPSLAVQGGRGVRRLDERLLRAEPGVCRQQSVRPISRSLPTS